MFYLLSKVNKTFFYVSFIFMLVSCYNDGKSQIIKTMMKRKVSISLEKMYCIGNDEDCIEPNLKGYKWLIVYSLEGCKPCIVSNVCDWENFQHNCKENGMDFSVVSIFETKSRQIDELCNAYHELNVSSMIYVDTTKVFCDENPHIPEKNLYRTFLIDSSNNVILVGNPIRNIAIEQMFYDIMKKAKKRKGTD